MIKMFSKNAEMDNIYDNTSFILEYKTPKIVNSWILVLRITFILFIIIMFIPYNTYNSYTGYVVIENNQSFILLDRNIKLYKDLYIGDKKYNYEIVDTNDYIKIKIDLEEKLKINALYIDINIRSDRKNLYQFFKNKIKKGLGL